MPTLHAHRAAAVVLLALTSAACSSDDDDAAAVPTAAAPVVQIGAPGATNRELAPDEVAELETPGYTDADVAFVQGMIHHHQQALTMTALVAARAGRSDLPQMAERMDVSQRDEIAQLEAWLAERGEDVPDAHGAHGDAVDLMPGMLTAEQLAHLEAARGADFDELFLQYMVVHHEGAVMMVEQLLTAGLGGQEPQVFQLAQHVESDQQVEIARMKSLLAELAAEQ